ncbi:derriere protein-like [Bombina bombina]|uniref:derriere protein-like n=1 Tax=Bombina bombina TaxID=8345 RepID=UPI00235B2B23|nr:derriere protein-like [Bombina bombina]
MDASCTVLYYLVSFIFLTDSSEIPFHEKMLLKSLGLKRRPSPNNPGPVPRTLWDIFDKGINEERPCRMEAFGVPGNIVRSFRDQGGFISREAPQGPLCFQKHLFFDLTAVEKKEQVTFGRLEIKFKHNTYYGQEFRLNLYRTMRLSLKGMREMNRKLLVSQSFRILHKSIHLPLTKMVKDWTSPEKNMGLLLEIYAEGNSKSVRGLSGPCDQIRSLTHTTLLIVSLDPSNCKASRSKRNTHPTLPSPSNICGKKRLYIDFKDVGWQNWVIAPRGYMANYCHGECPYPLTELLRGTNHAVLQTLVHSIEPETTPLPCCAPTKLSPISMLYYDNNDNVVLRHYEDMVVDECGCK